MKTDSDLDKVKMYGVRPSGCTGVEYREIAEMKPATELQDHGAKYREIAEMKAGDRAPRAWS